MSQGDYIQYKKGTTMMHLYEEPPVLESGNYLLYKKTVLENTIQPSKPIYNQLLPSSRSIIMGMEMSSRSNCPQFLLCSGTQARPNRVAMSNVYAACRPPRPLYVKAGDAYLAEFCCWKSL